MTHEEALKLIDQAVISPASIWADLGAGSGTFTRALAEKIGPDGKVFAIDKQRLLREAHHPRWATILPVQADFLQPLPIQPLHGILMANALHYVGQPSEFLQHLQRYLQPRASLILIEYDRTWPNPWVPYPIPRTALEALLQPAGFGKPSILGTTISRYGQGEIYAAQAWLRT